PRAADPPRHGIEQPQLRIVHVDGRGSPHHPAGVEIRVLIYCDPLRDQAAFRAALSTCAPRRYTAAMRRVFVMSSSGFPSSTMKSDELREAHKRSSCGTSLARPV